MQESEAWRTNEIWSEKQIWIKNGGIDVFLVCSGIFFSKLLLLFEDFLQVLWMARSILVPWFTTTQNSDENHILSLIINMITTYHHSCRVPMRGKKHHGVSSHSILVPKCTTISIQRITIPNTVRYMVTTSFCSHRELCYNRYGIYDAVIRNWNNNELFFSLGNFSGGNHAKIVQYSQLKERK